MARNTFMDYLASLPLPSIEEESTDVLLYDRTNHCFKTLTDPYSHFSAKYLQDKADELRAIIAELTRRGAITGIPQTVAGVLSQYPAR